MKRLLDIILSIILLVIFLPLILVVSLLIKLESKGSIFFISDRVGKNNQIFKMIKFRTMYFDTELVESNEIKDPNKKLTNVGKILRRYSIDEIPQFLSVISGKMSIVGPRPALKSQLDLINKRTNLGIEKLKPGITGLAQINGRDMISIEKKVYYDHVYTEKKNILLDLKIIFKTVKVVLFKKGVSH